MPNQTMVYSCSAPEQEYTMVWFGIFLYLLISSLKIRFCEQSVFAKSPLSLDSLMAQEVETEGCFSFHHSSTPELSGRTTTWLKRKMMPMPMMM